MSTPNLILSTLALEAAVLCASTEANRPKISGVHVEPDGSLTATDGHKLLHVPAVAASRDEWPHVQSPNGGAVPAAGLILAPAGVKAALGCEKLARPHTKRFPMLARRVALTVAESGSVEAAAGFHDGPRASVALVDGTYPDWRQVVAGAERKPRTLTVGFGIDNLRAMLDAAEKLGHGGIALAFADPSSAVLVAGVRGDGNTGDAIPFTGVVMPLHLSRPNAHATEQEAPK